MQLDLVCPIPLSTIRQTLEAKNRGRVQSPNTSNIIFALNAFPHFDIDFASFSTSNAQQSSHFNMASEIRDHICLPGQQPRHPATPGGTATHDFDFITL